MWKREILPFICLPLIPLYFHCVLHSFLIPFLLSLFVFPFVCPVILLLLLSSLCHHKVLLPFLFCLFFFFVFPLFLLCVNYSICLQSLPSFHHYVVSSLCIIYSFLVMYTLHYSLLSFYLCVLVFVLFISVCPSLSVR